eukprot:Rhum_TRINITY_DN15076_c7_g2::Rhum_TRINITY_DN15076_c7_g2_i1::g.136781::m.136781
MRHLRQHDHPPPVPEAGWRRGARGRAGRRPDPGCDQRGPWRCPEEGRRALQGPLPAVRRTAERGVRGLAHHPPRLPWPEEAEEVGEPRPGCGPEVGGGQEPAPDLEAPGLVRRHGQRGHAGVRGDAAGGDGERQEDPHQEDGGAEGCEEHQEDERVAGERLHVRPRCLQGVHEEGVRDRGQGRWWHARRGRDRRSVRADGRLHRLQAAQQGGDEEAVHAHGRGRWWLHLLRGVLPVLQVAPDQVDRRPYRHVLERRSADLDAAATSARERADSKMIRRQRVAKRNIRIFAPSPTHYPPPPHGS